MRADQIRYRMRENRYVMRFLEQAIVASRVRAGLDDPIGAEIRRIGASNAMLRALGAESWEHDNLTPMPRAISLPADTSEAARSDAEWYLADYAKRLDRAKQRTLVKEQRRNGHAGRRTLIGELFELYRADGCETGLREMIGAVKAFGG